MNWWGYPLIVVAMILPENLQSQVFETGPLSSVRLEAAAATAGFLVERAEANAPAAIPPRLPFAMFNYDDGAMVGLRENFHLQNVVAGAPDEWAAQLMLKEWVHDHIQDGEPKQNASHAQDILDFAAKGGKFWCTYYAITYVETAQALGWQARPIGVDRRHGPEGLGSKHHGVAEVWSNQFNKWVVIDAQSNLHFEKKGVPLSAWEIRAESLKNNGADVDRVVSAPPHTEKKTHGMAWWTWKDQDETSEYFWLYVTDHANMGTDGSTWKLVFPQDSANAHETWYQNDSDSGRGVPHLGYAKNIFLKTEHIEDAYWTVGVTKVDVKDASKGLIRFALESYCPNRSGYEVSFDERNPERVKDETSLKWNLHQGRNTLRLHTISRGNIRGPETAMILVLK